ncbi:MAG: hypothetical protein WDN69_31625 [Aliidongia sp.]
MVDVPLAKLRATAYQRLHQDQAALKAAAHEVDPSKPVGAVLAEMRKDHPTAETLLPTGPGRSRRATRLRRRSPHRDDPKRPPAQGRGDAGLHACHHRGRYGLARPVRAACDQAFLLRLAARDAGPRAG